MNTLRRVGLTLLPKNLVSRWAGYFVSLKLPRSWVQWEIKWFVRIFNVDLSEVKTPLDSFESLQEFFVRELKDDCRPIEPDPKAIASPCDGAYGQSGQIRGGEILQVKGRLYSVAQLLGDERLAKQFEGGTYATIYLSPRDYHCFHAPIAGRITATKHIPGYLWPVNAWAVQNIENLFSINERMVIEMPGIIMVAVGATMVGKVRLMFSSTQLNKGDLVGRFEFGSTIVMLASSDMGQIQSAPQGTSVRMGEKFGSMP